MQNSANPIDADLADAIASVPAGAWAVGVSGGADSVALLALLRRRGDLSLRVAHLDHQTRSGASAVDANFVETLSKQWNLPCEIARLDEISPQPERLPRNRSARFREARLAYFRKVVQRNHLAGVILAHHALDQAETIMLRMLRGSSYVGLAGMLRRANVGGLKILRPMLDLDPNALREHLRKIGQTWREDASNASPQYARNRVRVILRASPNLAQSLLELGEGCRAIRNWTEQFPAAGEQLSLHEFRDLPGILAQAKARRWLAARGAPQGELTPAVVDRLVAMANDLATPARAHFPGRLLVRRRGGVIFVDRLGDRGGVDS